AIQNNGEHVSQAQQEVTDASEQLVASGKLVWMILSIVSDNAVVVRTNQNYQLVALARVRVVLFDATPVGIAADRAARCISSELVQPGLLAALVIVGWNFAFRHRSVSSVN